MLWSIINHLYFCIKAIMPHNPSGISFFITGNVHNCFESSYSVMHAQTLGFKFGETLGLIHKILELG